MQINFNWFALWIHKRSSSSKAAAAAALVVVIVACSSGPLTAAVVVVRAVVVRVVVRVVVIVVVYSCCPFSYTQFEDITMICSVELFFVPVCSTANAVLVALFLHTP